MASSSVCAREEVAPSLHDAAGKVVRGCPSEAPQTNHRFPRSYRLTARRQFVEVYNRGRKVRRRGFMAFGLPNEVGACRIGLTVTKRTGNAVARNRIKRKLRDVFRRHREQMPVAMDLVVNGGSAILGMSARELEREFLAAVRDLMRKVPS